MILTLRELAQMLRVNERTILRMLKSGQLQGAKIGGQWRFNSSQIDGLFFPGETPRESSEDIPLNELTRSHLGIPISRVMSDTRMVLSLTGHDAESVIEELTNPRMLNPVLLDVSDLRSKCVAREELLSTGVGRGVALPHPRDPVTTLRAPAVIVFGRSAEGIEFKAADGKPVHLFFLMCSQSIELHLHLMGRMARLLRQNDFIAQCMNCATPQDVMRLVMESERDEFLAQV
jgi:excisionase family DNA binding protein